MKRADTGVYTITAKNNSGTDQVEVEISVLSMLSKLMLLWENVSEITTVYVSRLNV